MSNAHEHRMFCTLPKVSPPPLPADLGMPRSEAIVLNMNKWINGTTLTYFFKKVGQFAWPDHQKAVVREAFGKWKALEIGLNFAEVQAEEEATLVIGLIQGDGSWSYVGTDVLNNRRHGCNMNFGWDLRTEWGHATALHEIGHALGMPHEHQSPLSGIVWDEEKVIAHFSAEPNNWDEPKIRWNIIRHLNPAEVEGSTWDPRSIMHYPFKPGLIRKPPPYDRDGTPENVELSANDQAWMRRFYPSGGDAPAIGLGELAPVSATTAEQTDFTFVPTETREYRVEAVGEADMKIALAEEDQDGLLRILKVADDSATPSNASITRKLKAGKPYRVSARTHYAGHPAGASVVVR